MQGRGKQSVAAGGDIGWAITGDNNQVVLAPPVRSAYREQVGKIAPPQLVDRERELAALVDFCTAGSGPLYAWWRAGAWAGKTALMSWFALHPPKGVRLVPFFVTARLGAQNDVAAYVDVVLEQLAEIAGEGLPANLWESTREAHLLRLYREAALACAERGERLVLLVDGLDEDRGVTTGAAARSIAGLLPARPDSGMRVLVSGRLNPPLPVDVPDVHPLRDPGIVRILEPSRYAQVIRGEAERELKHLIEAGGLEYDLLALVTAAGGGLSAEDLAELTGAVPYRVRDILRTRAGRTFGLRASVYLLGHEELQAQAEEMLGSGELDRYRAKLHAWADAWRERGWPDGTPEYLLRGYFRMLRASRAVDRMLDCALDAARHDRMLLLTGGDVAAVNEVRATEEALADRGCPDPLDALRLAVHRDWLGDRNAGLPDGLPRAWVAVGSTSRALALARSYPAADRRGAELAGVAEELQRRGGDPGRVLETLREAEECADHSDEQQLGDEVRVRVAGVLVAAGEYDRAAALARAAAGSRLASGPYTAAVAAWLEAGRPDRAEQLVRTAPNEECAAQGALALVPALLGVGRIEDAERVARAAVRPARIRALVLVVRAWDREGLRDRGHRLLDAVRRLAPTSDRRVEVVAALAGAGDIRRAQIFADGIHKRDAQVRAWEIVARSLVAAGRYEEAEARLVHLRDGGRSAILRDLAIARAKAGEYDAAEELAGRVRDPALAWQALRTVATELARAGCHDRAEALARRIKDPTEAGLTLGEEVIVLAQGGQYDRAERLARGIGNTGLRAEALRRLALLLAEAGEQDRAVELVHSLEGSEDRPRTLVELALAMSRGGRRETAERMLLDVEARTRVPAVPTVARKVSGAAKALALAGYRDEALSLLDGFEELIPRGELPDGATAESTALMDAVVALAAAGAMGRAERLAARAPFGEQRSQLMHLLAGWHAAAGRAEAAIALVGSYRFAGASGSPLHTVIRGLAAGGHFDRAESVVRQSANPGRLGVDLGLLAWALYTAGQHVRAKALANEAYRQIHRWSAWHRTEIVFLVRALACAGEQDKARRLAVRGLPMGDDALRRRPRPEVSADALLLIAIGEYDEAVARADCLTHPHERAQTLAEISVAVADAGELVRAEQVARTIAAPTYAARACAHVAAVTNDPARARDLTALALRSGGWVPALPGLLRHTESVELVVAAAEALKAACTGDRKAATAARTSAPSSN